MTIGKVYLVGAGPGAPDLITLRAVNTLQKAQVLLYDRLANPEIMRHAPASAERIYVGKTPGEDQEARQRRIHTLMIGHALSGKTVVRLKGGDPFVFGRGGEEILQLRDSGIEAEMVPGISSCISAPASAMIPVTYRGVASSFGVFAARPGSGAQYEEIDWKVAAGMETAVFLMGVERLPRIVEKLTELGRSPETPVAVIEKAYTPQERTIVGTLTNIMDRAEGVRPPATIIVGEVVALREMLMSKPVEAPAVLEFAS